MRKSIILTTSAALALAFSTAVLAQRPGGPGRGRPDAGVNAPDSPDSPNRPGPGRGGRFGGPRAGLPFLGIARNLDLTEDQKTKIRDIAEATRADTQPIRTELRETTSALRTEVLAGNSAKVTELSAKVSSLRDQLADARLKTTTSIVALLTPEQKEKLQTARENRGGRQAPGRRVGRGGGQVRS